MRKCGIIFTILSFLVVFTFFASSAIAEEIQSSSELETSEITSSQTDTSEIDSSDIITENPDIPTADILPEDVIVEQEEQPISREILSDSENIEKIRIALEILVYYIIPIATAVLIVYLIFRFYSRYFT